MGGKSSAERRADEAAKASDKARVALEDQTKIIKARADAEAKKAQRIAIRASRAAAGGFFGTDTPADRSSLGGSGSLG